MDAMTPDGLADREAETPSALRLMGEMMARQVELGIVIEQAHQSEVRAHRNTKMRLSHAESDNHRLRLAHQEALSREESIRRAMVGEEEPTPDGDALAEVRELYSKAYSLEQELRLAKELLESAGGSTPEWERMRVAWQNRVGRILGEPEPDDPALDPELGQEYDRPKYREHAPDGGNLPMFGTEPEEPHGESHS